MVVLLLYWLGGRAVGLLMDRALFYGAESFVVRPVVWVIYITDMGNNRTRTCTPSGNDGTLTGTGMPNTNVGNIDGILYWPIGFVMDSTSTNLYITCYYGNTLRQEVLSTVTTIVGSGTYSSPPT